MKHRRERDVVTLDRAIVQLAQGNSKDAEQNLRKVRDSFDHLEQKAVGEKALSMLTDATFEAYPGEDYEKVLVRVFLAISNLMNGGGDADAYALQVADKQQQIISDGRDKNGDNPKLSYKQVAVGAYLHGALREATHSNYDDVARSSMLVCHWQPEFPYAMQDLDRAKHGHHSAPGNGVLYVFALVGVGPHKEESVEVASTVSLLIADRILSAIGNQNLPPTIAPIKVPKVVLAANEPGLVGVSIDGHECGRTATITDIGQMAVDQYEAIYPRVIAEAVVRRVVKKSVIYGAMEATGTQKNSLAGAGLRRLGRGLGSHRVGRHALLGPAARKDPGAASGAAGRRTSNGAAIGGGNGLCPGQPLDAKHHDCQRPQYLCAGEFPAASTRRADLGQDSVKIFVVNAAARASAPRSSR